ncbi:sulfatase-like hydrolase/transferase [Ruficoccus amylovorans]|uniref:Sulfatase-like hydrolase/transferase n=1 Tax=Ruficoccus amylovorans TaxID=1804625 RepID=A0A842HE67_9BACT|nr:sulfatase-like hydrolase/transferase [Ruficoccus amylovorans]MBC2593956.1 sulfatase-like hydrolase/transferase [Ruficoccus amylovorans]
MDRRSFIQTSATAFGATLLGSNKSPASTTPGTQSASTLGTLPSQPNIVLFISDQQRPTMHFPEGWEEENLPTMTRLKNNGLNFNRAYCATAMCSPSRSALFTGLYPAQNGVEQTLSFFTCDGSTDPSGTPCCELSQAEVELSPNIPTLATVLRTAGYRCFFKGKWHLTKPDPATEDSLLPYGFEDWDPPDAGGDTAPENAARGPNQNDARYVSDALDFINTYNDPAPFLLVVSLVNPHDVLGYPSNFEAFDYSVDYLSGDIPPPVNSEENLANEQINYQVTVNGVSLPATLLPSSKPSAHISFKYSSIGLGPLNTEEKQYNYINFYANLIKLVDSQFGEILSAMDARGFTDNSLVLRLADHGEHGIAHGGLRQKSFTMYEEALRVPLIISNPQLYQGAFETDSLFSLIDMVPTLATLAGVPNLSQFKFRGTDMSPVIQNPEATPPQTELLFTYDDIRCGQCLTQVIPPPNRLRALFTDRYKYCRYFDGDGVEPEQYEMYDLQADPFEMENLADPDHPRYELYSAERTVMSDKLALAEQIKLAPLPTETPMVVINDNSGSLTLSWEAEASVNYQVQASEDLETWEDVGELLSTPTADTLTVNVTWLFDTYRTNDTMFFRLRMP